MPSGGRAADVELSVNPFELRHEGRSPRRVIGIADAPCAVISFERGERRQPFLASIEQGPTPRTSRLKLAREQHEPHCRAHDRTRKRQGHVDGRSALVRDAAELEDERHTRLEARSHAHDKHRSIDWGLLQPLELL